MIPHKLLLPLLAKEDEDSCRGLCKQVVDEWVERETEKIAQAKEEKDEPKELTGTPVLSSFATYPLA